MAHNQFQHSYIQIRYQTAESNWVSFCVPPRTPARYWPLALYDKQTILQPHTWLYKPRLSPTEGATNSASAHPQGRPLA